MEDEFEPEKQQYPANEITNQNSFSSESDGDPRPT